jgi:hypothetical protein
MTAPAGRQFFIRRGRQEPHHRAAANSVPVGDQPDVVNNCSVGDGYDNAITESFFATLARELLDRRTFRSHGEARLALFEYIEGF